MLKFKINNLNTQLEYETLNVSGMTYSADTNYGKIFVSSANHKLRDNDAVQLVCVEGGRYAVDLDITVFDDDIFYFDNLPNVNVSISAATKEYVDYKIEYTNPFESYVAASATTYLSGATLADDTDYSYVDIPLGNYARAEIVGGTETGVTYSYAIYDANNNFISAVTTPFTSITNTIDLTLYPDAKYIRLSGSTGLEVVFSYPEGYNAANASIKSKLALKLALYNEHYFDVGKETYYISYVIDDTYYADSTIVHGSKCEGDYVYYNGFVYTATTYNSKYSISGDYWNYSAVTVNFTYSGKTYTLKDGIIPMNEEGEYDGLSLYFFYSDNDEAYNKILDIVVNHYNDITITYSDPRFFIINGEAVTFAQDSAGNEMSTLLKEVGNNHISFSMGETFATDTKRDELFYENYLEDVEENSINEIIDYEKSQFLPMYYDYTQSGLSIQYLIENGLYDDSNLKPVSNINFNLHFRSRNNTYDTDGNVLKEWVVTDESYWNNYTVSDSGEFTLTDELLAISGDTDRDSYADCLGYLNFTDDDVYYQKSKLKKSFIRLSFYDSRDRATQALQFYSTIFIDSGKMYTKYIKAKNNDLDGTDFVSMEHISGNTIVEDERLGVSFTSANNYDMTASSEGFYLYLFPSLVEGDIITPLYMKVEFNHAKYGRVIPMSMPTYETTVLGGNEEELLKRQDTLITDYKYFPIHYLSITTGTTTGDDGETTTSSVITGVNMARVLNDTYIKVYAKYNSLTNQYVWFLPRTTDHCNGSDMTFNLWEPRVNGFETINTDHSSLKPEDPLPEGYYNVVATITNNVTATGGIFFFKLVMDDVTIYEGSITNSYQTTNPNSSVTVTQSIYINDPYSTVNIYVEYYTPSGNGNDRIGHVVTYNRNVAVFDGVNYIVIPQGERVSHQDDVLISRIMTYKNNEPVLVINMDVN